MVGKLQVWGLAGCDWQWDKGSRDLSVHSSVELNWFTKKSSWERKSVASRGVMMFWERTEVGTIKLARGPVIFLVIF